MWIKRTQRPGDYFELERVVVINKDASDNWKKIACSCPRSEWREMKHAEQALLRHRFFPVYKNPRSVAWKHRCPYSVSRNSDSHAGDSHASGHHFGEHLFGERTVGVCERRMTTTVGQARGKGQFQRQERGFREIRCHQQYWKFQGTSNSGDCGVSHFNWTL